MSNNFPAIRPKAEKLAESSFLLGIASILCGITALPAIIQSIRALICLRKENASKKVALKAVFSLTFSTCVLAFVIASISSTLSALQALDDQRYCTDNLKQLALAIKVYSGDNGDHFPTAQWCDLVLTKKSQLDAPSFDVSKSFRCRSAPTNLRCTYAMNQQLIGVKDTGQIPEDTVMLFESDAGWNAVGGLDIMVKRHRNGSFVAFADGSVQEIKPEDFKTLRWAPFTNSPAN